MAIFHSINSMDDCLSMMVAKDICHCLYEGCQGGVSVFMMVAKV